MKEDFLEDIKKAISSTTRAIAEDKEIDVVFEDNLSSTDNKIVLPKIDNNEDLKNLNLNIINVVVVVIIIIEIVAAVVTRQ